MTGLVTETRFLLLKVVLGSTKNRRHLARHFLLNESLEPPSRAVTRHKYRGLKRLEVLDTLLHLFRGSVCEMIAADNRMNWTVVKLFGVSGNIDKTGVAAAGEDDESLVYGLLALPFQCNMMHTFDLAHDKPLVHDEFVLFPRVGLRLIADAAPNSKLIVRLSRDFARDQKHVVQHRLRLSIGLDLATCVLKFLQSRVCFKRQDVRTPVVASMRRPIWRNDNRDSIPIRFPFVDEFDGRDHAARMITMPVRQSHNFNLAHVESKSLSIPLKNIALGSTVKQQAVVFPILCNSLESQL